MDVGQRVRMLRQEQGLTLAQVAGDELSVALVSKVERGLVSPSLATLGVLSKRLAVRAGALLDEAADDGGAAALNAARAYLLLGDPARAAGEASKGRGKGGGSAERIALLATEAEALLAAGASGAAAERVLEASRLDASGDAPAVAAARAALSWTLGLLERRRGNRAGALRSWSACLDSLQLVGAAGGDPWMRLVQARAQLELAALHEQDGAPETARVVLSEAVERLAGLADAGALAHALLGDARAESGGAHGDALAVAVCASAERLVDQARSALARVERGGQRWPAAVAPAEVTHSRHLR